MVGITLVGVIVLATLAGVTGALVVTRAVPVATTRRGRAHVAPVVAVALLAALIWRVATRATLELATTAAMLLPAVELAGPAALVRPTPVATTTLIIAVAAVVARFTRTRTTFEVTRRTTRPALIMTREVAPAATTRVTWIGPAPGVETVVRTRCATRVVAWIVPKRRAITVACARRRVSRIVARREIARRAWSTVVARMAETVVRPALVAAVRATRARPITERAIRAAAVGKGPVALRSIAVRPITLWTVAVATLLRPLVALVERGTAELAAPLALFGAQGRTMLVAAFTRAVITRAIVTTTVAAGAVTPGWRTVVRAAVHRASVVVTARATLLERAITKRALATWPIAPRPIAEATRARATVAGAWAEAVVGAETAT